ncbi:hypothetical protein D3C81_2061210 [compost metagenome]
MALHFIYLLDLAVEPCHEFVMLERPRHGVRQQLLELLETETRLLRALDDLQGLQRLLRVTPIAIGRAFDLTDQALCLVKADT